MSNFNESFLLLFLFALYLARMMYFSLTRRVLKEKKKIIIKTICIRFWYAVREYFVPV